MAPLLEELGTEEEEAARTLGASPLQTFFRVTLPNIRWGLLYGIALTTARAIGEIGAVLDRERARSPGKTETATLYILRAFDEGQDASGLHRRPDARARLDRAAGRHRVLQTQAGEGARHMSSGIVIEDLTKRFGSFEAVERRQLRGAGRARSRRSSGRAARERARCCG